ncbi:hypothetical protein ElyMa_002482200 [Elysia marginata]|uniref:Uncharacterized protein n=1 Tax=Elysia marginata TaxID=1093978 RepID=A0AAV4GMM7_9GAST|nr:hypothetical protein ElyMa_002482200 [Elysia marginata]
MMCFGGDNASGLNSGERNNAGRDRDVNVDEGDDDDDDDDADDDDDDNDDDDDDDDNNNDDDNNDDDDDEDDDDVQEKKIQKTLPKIKVHFMKFVMALFLFLNTICFHPRV